MSRRADACDELGVSDQTLRNCVKAVDIGTLSGSGTNPVKPEQGAVSRLEAENVSLKRRSIPKKRGSILRKGCAMKYAWVNAQRPEFAIDLSVIGLLP